MKKIIIVLIVAITTLLFWSPWMGDDASDRLIREVPKKEEFTAELNELIEEYSYDSETKEGCDGLSLKWAPFGRTIMYCEYGNWYVTFLGDMF